MQHMFNADAFDSLEESRYEAEDDGKARQQAVGLITVRQVAEGTYNHILATEYLIDNRVTFSNKGIGYLFPLYLYHKG